VNLLRTASVALSLVGIGCRSVSPTSTTGTIADIGRNIERLVRSTDSHAFLVIELDGTPHFLQFTAGPKAIEMDFPQVTDAQRRRAGAFRALCASAGLPLRESDGSDGSRFLDCDLPRDAARASAVVERALIELFDASSTTPLRFSGDRLPDAT